MTKLRPNRKDNGHATRMKKSCTTYKWQHRINNENIEREYMRYGRGQGISNVQNRLYDKKKEVIDKTILIKAKVWYVRLHVEQKTAT